MKYPVYLIGIFIWFLSSSFAFAQQPNCNISGMISSPQEEPYASQWKDPVCLNLLNLAFYQFDSSQKSRLSSALEQLPQELWSSTLFNYLNELRNAVDGHWKDAGYPLPTQEKCELIYKARTEKSCPRPVLEFTEYDWFNSACIQVLTAFVKDAESLSKREQDFIVKGLNQHNVFSQCCMLFQHSVCQTSLRSEADAVPKELISRYPIRVQIQHINTDGAVVAPIVNPPSEGENVRSSKEETSSSVLLDEVIVYGSSPKKTKKAVEEYFRENPVGAVNKRGKKNGAQDGARQGAAVSEQECLELENAASSSEPCEDMDGLFSFSDNKGWARPACLEEVFRLMSDTQDFDSVADKYGGELAFFNRLLFVENSFSKYDFCRKNYPGIMTSYADYSKKRDALLQAVRARGKKFRRPCQTLEAATAANVCSSSGEELLLSPSGWGSPSCISAAADYFSSLGQATPVEQDMRRRFIVEHWPVLVKNVQHALDSFSEYKSCRALGHIKANETSFTAFRTAEEKLAASLTNLGVRFTGRSLEGVPFAGDAADETVGLGDTNPGNGETNPGESAGENPDGKTDDGMIEGTSLPFGKQVQHWDSSSWWIGLGILWPEEYLNGTVDIVTDED